MAVVALLACTAVTGGTANSLDSDLLAHWPFEEGVGATQTADVTGNGYDGTIHRAEWTVNGCRGWALQFAGEDVPFEPFEEATYVETSFRLTSLTDQTELTLSAWLRTSSQKTQTIMGYYSGGVADLLVPLLNHPYPNDIHFNVRNPHGQRNTIEVSTGLSIDDDEWHHLAFRRKSDSELDVFIDGSRQLPKNVLFDDPLSSYEQSAEWYIGAINDIAHARLQSVFNGTIDDVKVYGRALTDDEVATEAASGCEDVNNAPIANAGGPYLVAAGETTTLDGTGSSDPDGDLVTYGWDFDADGLFDDAAGSTPAYSNPDEGIFNVGLEVEDPSGATHSHTAIVVVYDPGGGFVTGGGTIDSPAGALYADPSVEGTARFGLVSRYKKGADTPNGQTEFQFQIADLNFHSASYEWLVVAGAQAKFKGTGTINGEGNYGFMISATDAKLTPSTEDDRFRIKIWDRDHGDLPIYDNEFTAEGYDDPGASTDITGGSIVIHKP